MSFLEIIGVSKRFGPVQALKDITMTINKGEIHAIVGENGAGKSTLMNILSGVYPHGEYEGVIRLDGKECAFSGIPESEKRGIAIIHQELALTPYLTIAENIFFGHERNRFGVINWKETYAESSRLMEIVGLQDSPTTPVHHLGVGKQQMVEIAKALAKQCTVLILDEPTAALNDEDSIKLLNLLKKFRESGMTCILISHKLNEVAFVADRITVIRDGATIETIDVAADGFSEDRLITSMVGRSIEDRFPSWEKSFGDVGFRIEDWSVNDTVYTDRNVIDSVTLEVRRGEVVGIAGLMGAGRTELAMSVFGRSFGSNFRGAVYKDGRRIDLGSVDKAIRHGIAYVSEDRKKYGLILDETIRENMTLASLEKISTLAWINEVREFTSTDRMRESLRIRTPSVNERAGNLSGGNQQKIVLGKWLLADPDILILDEPTRGIDVGAKFEVYTIIGDMARRGKCILLISSEMDELLGLCDRVYVMAEGGICGEFTRGAVSQEAIMRAIVNNTSRSNKLKGAAEGSW